MNIEKILIIESPKQFYQILLKENILSGSVSNFLRAWLKWERGCNCNLEELLENMKSEYDKLSYSDLSYLCQKIGCDRIEFK
jgi:hypothetical protein